MYSVQGMMWHGTFAMLNVSCHTRLQCGTTQASLQPPTLAMSNVCDATRARNEERVLQVCGVRRAANWLWPPVVTMVHHSVCYIQKLLHTVACIPHVPLRSKLRPALRHVLLSKKFTNVARTCSG